MRDGHTTACSAEVATAMEWLLLLVVVMVVAVAVEATE
jgi:hypothetical protein